MNWINSDNFLRIGLIVAGLLVIISGGLYMAVNFVPPAPTPAVVVPVVTTPAPTATPTATGTATPSPTRPRPSPTPTPAVPLGGIVYALSPDINSVGWVQAGEDGNHFGESFLYTGLRDGLLYHGAMQFDLSFVPKGSTIFMAELVLTGIDDQGLTPDSAFAVSLLAEEVNADWSQHNYEIIHNAPVDASLAPLLEADSLGIEQVNTLIFNAAQRSIIEERIESKLLSIRLDSMTPDQASSFAWDSGYGDQTKGHGPVLRLGVLPPLPTATPTAELALAEAELESGSGDGAGEGEGEEGTPEVVGTLIMITSTPTPENLQTAAAFAAVATVQATTTGTATPVPLTWVTPVVVTATPTPENEATALFQIAEATAAVIVYGTSTPAPPNLVTATPTPTETATPIFTLLEGELPPTMPIPTITVTPLFIPNELIGKIAFKSDRPGTSENDIYVINPDGSGLALLGGGQGNACWPYYLAEEADTYSADGRFRVFTKDVIRYKNVDDPTTGETTGVVRDDAPGIYWYDSLYQTEEQLTEFGAGIAYGGVWSPVREQIAFVSTESQNDEIWVANYDSSGLLQLTRDEYAWWDKHPSWSPDGQQIVFHSNRTGHNQIFVMNADGSNLYSLSRTGYNDYEPVWLKYPGIPLFESEAPEGITHRGSFGFCGPDANCSAFNSQPEAQAFFLEANGGQLTLDPHGLDSDHDGLACENLSSSVSSTGP